MTITIADGRGALWQWDTGRRVKITDGDGVKQVHYQNKCFGRSVDVDVGTDGTAVIPDELLQDCHTLTAYAYVTDDTGAYTMVQQDFAVHKRAKPSGYVYTPTDQMTLQMIQRQIGDLADLTTEAKDTLVAAINEAARTGGGAGSMDLRVADGYVQYSTDGGMTWTNLIAMADLKGDPGAPGKDGHSPVVTATKSGKTTTISVDGAAIATVEDGADGSPVNWRGVWGENTEYSKLDAVSYDGSSYIFKPDTHVIGSIPGVDEEWGLMTQKGNDGANGVTPHIGDNGNWYLGSTDTGKPSRGETGAQGAPGVYYGTTQPTGDTHPVWIDPGGEHDDGGLLPAVTAADNGKVLRVASGAWSAQEMPEALPNPNALTFTGAVTGIYDGSAPLSVEIPSGGGSGSDISLGLTGATVGQIAKITAVDDTGKPTAWAPVDMPSGGGGSAETFELIKYIKTTEAVNEIRINADDIGEPFELEEVQIYTQLYLQDDANSAISIKLHSSINGSATNYNWPFIAISPNIKSNTAAQYPAAYAGHFKPKNYTIDNKKYWIADTWSSSNAGSSHTAGAVNRIDFLLKSAYETHVMDAVRCVMINANNGAVQIGANSEIWIFGKRGKVT